MVRATSTSSVVSIVYDASPSTSPGSTPASASAARMARHASAFSLPSTDLPNSVWPMPAMAVRSRSSAAPVSELPALALGRAPLDEGGDALLGVVRRLQRLLAPRLLLERRHPVGVERPVEGALVDRQGLGGRRGQSLGPLLRRPSELARGHDLVDQPDALGVGRRQIVAEEHQL